MSLYEQFHSDINKGFMFNIIKDEINKSLSIDISLDPNNYNDFLSFFNPIFDSNDVDEIEILNKDLLDKSIKFFTDKITPTDNLEKLLQQRESTLSTINESNENMAVLQNESIPPYSMIEDIEKTNQVKPIPPSEDTNIPVKRSIKPFTITSSKRNNINSSRFNYRIDLTKHSILSKNIHKISKIVLPLEENYIFDLPVIHLSIPELDCNVHMQQEKIIENKNKKCGVYVPTIDHIIEVNNIDKITIDIRDITETKYPIYDILKINIIEVDESSIRFTCSNIHKNNFKVGDNIKIINIHSNERLKNLLLSPFRIKKIDKNLIICKLNDIFEEGVYNDIDMKLMNMSNQNIIFFN